MVSDPNCHSIKLFTESLLAIEMRKTQIFMQKRVYLGTSILEISKIVMYEFQYDHLKPRSVEKTKLCYIDTDSLQYP